MMSTRRKTVIIIGAGTGGYTCAKELAKLNDSLNILVITRNDFVEWQSASTFFMCHAKREYTKFVIPLTVVHTPNEALLEMSQVDTQSTKIIYLLGDIYDVSDRKSSVSYCDRSGRIHSIKFDYLVVASGFCLPIFQPGTFQTLQQRYEHLLALEQGLRSAKEITLIGGGAVAVEMVGSVREVMGEDCELTMAVPDDDLLPGWSPITRQYIERKLNEFRKPGVRITKNSGRCTTQIWEMAQCFDATLKFDEVGWKTDVAIPSYSRGPATRFLPRRLLTSDKRVEVDQYLRVEGAFTGDTLDRAGNLKDSGTRGSSGNRECLIFAIGSATTRSAGWVGQIRLEPQAKHVAKNIHLHVTGQRMLKYEEPMSDTLTEPPLSVLGHRTWAYLNVSVLPPFYQYLCTFCGFPISCLVCPTKPCICGCCGTTYVGGEDLARGFAKPWLHYSSRRVYPMMGKKQTIESLALNVNIPPDQITMIQPLPTASFDKRSVGKQSMGVRSYLEKRSLTGEKTSNKGWLTSNVSVSERSTQQDQFSNVTLKTNELILERTKWARGPEAVAEEDNTPSVISSKRREMPLLPGQTAG